MLKSHRLVIILFCIAAIAGTYSNEFQRLEMLSYDLFSRLLPDTKQKANVAVIGIDQNSIDTMGKWPWARHDIANLIAHVQDADPAAVGIMLPLDQPQLVSSGGDLQKELSNVDEKLRKEIEAVLNKLDPDPVLTSALARGGKAKGKKSNVVLAIPYWSGQVAGLEGSSSVYGESFKPVFKTEASSLLQKPELAPLIMSSEQRYLFGQGPFKELAGAAAGLGFVQSVYSGVSVYREPLVLERSGDYYPSFVLQLLTQYYKQSQTDVSVVPHQSVVVKDYVYNTDYDNAIYPRVDKSIEQSISVYSAVDMVNNAVDKKNLAGKVVIIGFTAVGFAPVMQGPGETEFIPVTWAAQSVNSLIAEDTIAMPSWSLGVQRGAIIILALYLLLLPRRMRGRTGLIVSFILTLALVNTSLVLMLTKSLWLMLTVPALFVLLGHFLIALHNHFSMLIQGVKNETSDAYVKLGSFHQAQGRLDEALECFQKCPLNESMMESLYKLALDYERRRQFSKATIIYETIAKKNPGYKDVKERNDHHKTLPNKSNALSNTATNMAATVVVDNSKVENTVLGRYELARELGRGAMGMVYLGKDPTIGRTVAIKTMALSEEFDDEHVEEVRRRFFIEAETAGRLNHPDIVTIYDAGEEHDLAYIAMDYIKGEPLNNFVRSEKLLPIKTVFNIGIRAAEALDYAHRQKVVHRDVKPGNMLYDLEADALKITDFGIACLTDNSKTRSGTVLGSPSYMSPEQLSGARVDGRSDLFSLGVTLYQLFSGVLPFQAESMAALAYKIMNDKPGSIRKERSELPTCITRILNKAMDKDPNNRYQDGVSMAEALKRCVN